jgi:hypothetical protein
MRLWLMVYLILMVGACACAETTVSRVMRAVPASSLKIDGRLESEWLQGAVADSFVQRQPAQGQQPSLPTRAYILYDKNALYVAFLCLDSSPDSIHSRVQRRDNDANSDEVQLILDSFHDLRNGYFFGVTACGVQVDGTVSNETYVDPAWDGIWQSAVGRTDSGWVAELRIPFSSIRHGGSRSDGWGINLNRYIERRNEDDFWTPVSLERGFHISEMGRIEGLDNIAPARHIEILPHAVGRWDAPAGKDWASKNEWANLGGHVKIVPSGSWTMDLAYQPDFAQVDVDNEVINLSNYPVYLYEKRPFFLEAKDLYENAPIMLFYTRRITDPDYGGRLSAQAGNFRWTVLGAKNKAESGKLQNAGSGRLVCNLGKLSSIGVTTTYIDSTTYADSADFRAAAVSVDSRIRWGQRNLVYMAAAGVDRTGRDKQPLQGFGGVFLDLGMVNLSSSLDYRGMDYNINDMGWDNYSNVFQQKVGFSKEWYPGKHGLYRWTFANNYRRRTFTDGSHAEGAASLEVSATTRSYWTATLGGEWGDNFYRNYYAYTRPYRDNFSVWGFDTEYYKTSWQWASLQTDPRLPVEATIAVDYRTYREGHRFSLAPDFQIKPRPNLDFSLGLDWERVTGVPPQKLWEIGFSDPSLMLWRLKAHYSPSVHVTLRGTVQWLEYERRAYTNLLLAWNWHPGSWFYVVFDEAGRATNPLMMNRPGDRTVRVKWTYYLTVP